MINQRKIGEKFVNTCIEKIPVGHIITGLRIGRNEFDAILIKSNRKVVEKWKDIKDKEKEIINGKEIYILEFTRGGEFKDIKANFGELLKVPLLMDKYPKAEMKGFFSIHESIEEPSYKRLVTEELKNIADFKFKVDVIELKDIKRKLRDLD